MILPCSSILKIRKKFLHDFNLLTNVKHYQMAFPWCQQQYCCTSIGVIHRIELVTKLSNKALICYFIYQFWLGCLVSELLCQALRTQATYMTEIVHHLIFEILYGDKGTANCFHYEICLLIFCDNAPRQFWPIKNTHVDFHVISSVTKGQKVSVKTWLECGDGLYWPIVSNASQNLGRM